MRARSKRNFWVAADSLSTTTAISAKSQVLNDTLRCLPFKA
jgi:hypothetical protein